MEGTALLISSSYGYSKLYVASGSLGANLNESPDFTNGGHVLCLKDIEVDRSPSVAGIINRYSNIRRRLYERNTSSIATSAPLCFPCDDTLISSADAEQAPSFCKEENALLIKAQREEMLTMKDNSPCFSRKEQWNAAGALLYEAEK
jgi:hypothetical protein